MKYKCPKCGTEDIRIMATICVKPEKDGYEVRDAAEWDGNHGAFCIGCDFSGNVDQFEVVEPEIDAINP